jgi:hypothetical protein
LISFENIIHVSCRETFDAKLNCSDKLTRQCNSQQFAEHQCYPLILPKSFSVGGGDDNDGGDDSDRAGGGDGGGGDGGDGGSGGDGI